MNPEDLRPETLDAMVGQKGVIRILKGLIDRSKTGGVVPHLLFHGPPGVGKTTAAWAFGRAILGDTFSQNFREMNASDERKIETVREDISVYVGHEPAFGAEFKILFLDEADMMTDAAQHALRRMMETGSGTTRFILSCNYPSKVIDALHSRCLSVAFRPLTDDEIRAVLKSVADRLALSPDPRAIESIVAHCDGQPRDAVNALIGGNDESMRWLRLDERIIALLSNNGTDSVARIEGFCQGLRQEGFTEFESVLDSVRKVGLRDKLIPLDKYPQLVETLAQHGRWMTEVEVPLLQVRSALYATARILGWS